MRKAFRTLSRASAVALGIWALTASTSGQGAAKSAEPARAWTAPRAPDGHPDLQGVWSYATITPLERPPELADKAVLTEREAAEWEKLVLARENRDTRSTDKLVDVGNAYNDFWWDRGTKAVGTRATSLVIDPPDGRLPPLVPEAEKKATALREIRSRLPHGPEDRSAAERCLGFSAGPPMIPTAYNNHVQIFQTPGHVALVNEMIHDARVAPLSGAPHPGRNVGLWRGDARARWEGQTLIIDTANFNDQARVSYDNSATATLHVVERFTRVGVDSLMYEFTVEDPATWTRPWSGRLLMTRSHDHIYEYACHEGNYAMAHMLSGSRAEEQAAGVAAK